MRRTVGAALLAVLVVSAGCLGATGPGTATAGDDGDATGSDLSSVDGPAGAVDFYVSDRPNDMDDFEHLNVTVTSVRFHLVEGASDANETTTATANETTTATANETTTATANGTARNATATERADEDDERGEDERSEDERDGDEDDDGEDGRWVVRDVNATTVDLTRLRGDNATLVGQFGLPAGEYDKVFLEVSAVDGTLTTGESTEVKLPSERLQLNSRFTVENGSETGFVYDISVHRAGKSGKYILRPVVGESGVDQPIEVVDDERGRDDADDEGEDALAASFGGPVKPGENVTVRVTRDGDPVANASVTVDGDAAGTTNADGEYVVAVPADAEELELAVEAGDGEAELEREFADGETDETETDEVETDDGDESEATDDSGETDSADGPPDDGSETDDAASDGTAA